MSKVEREWDSYSPARKQEEVAYLREMHTISLLGGISWLTLMAMVFLTLGTMTPGTPDQNVLRQFAVIFAVLIGGVVVFATYRWGWAYSKLLRKL